MSVVVEVITAGNYGVPGFTTSPLIVADFSPYGTDTALVTLPAPSGITGVLQGGLSFENPATWGSVWPTSTQVPNQQSGIMTHLWVEDTSVVEIVKVLSSTEVIVKDPTGTIGGLGNGVNCYVLDANYKAPARISMTSTGDWWLGGVGDVNVGGNGQLTGLTYVVEGGKPYMVATLASDVFCVIEYYNVG